MDAAKIHDAMAVAMDIRDAAAHRDGGHLAAQEHEMVLEAQKALEGEMENGTPQAERLHKLADMQADMKAANMQCPPEERAWREVVDDTIAQVAQ